MFVCVDNPCRIFVEDGKDVSNMLQTCYKRVTELLLTKLLLILEKKECIRLHNVCANKKNITIMCDFSQEIFGDFN